MMENSSNAVDSATRECSPEAIFNTENKPVAHTFANIIYWASVILLLVAARELISPGTRKAGEFVHIIITLLSFELYMWLLVGLVKWHNSKKLIFDCTRGIIFTLAISGFFFMTLNELYLISGRIGMLVSAVSLVSALVKYKILKSIVKLEIPKFQSIFMLGWLILTVIPAPIFKRMDSDESYINAILYCWLLIIYLTTHVFAIKKQRELGYNISQDNPFDKWYVSWFGLLIMLVFCTAQCLSVIYVFADFCYWYFSPLLITAAILGIALAHTCGQGKPIAWAVFGLMVMFLLSSGSSSSLPQYFPNLSSAKDGTLAYTYNNLGYSGLLDPYIPPILYGSFVFALCAVVLSLWWMLFIAAIAPTVYGGIKLTNFVAKCKNGKGFAMLLGSFLLLGAAVAIQWAQEKWGNNTPLETSGTPEPEHESENNI